MSSFPTSLRAIASLAAAVLSCWTIFLAQPASAAEGDLDTTFGDGGKVVTPLPGGGGADAVEVLRDGSILVGGGGWWSEGSSAFVLARYVPDGSLDPSFGDGGVVSTYLGPGFAGIESLAIQPNGRIIAAGSWEPNVDERQLVLIRYDRDGTLDPTFGNAGIVVTDLPSVDETCYGVVVQHAGKIVCAGWMWGREQQGDFLLVRYDRHGELDPTFGEGGVVQTSFGAHEGAVDLVVQRDSKLVAVGFFDDYAAGVGRFAIARYLRDGTLDAGFDVDGRVTTEIPGLPWGMSTSVALGPGRTIVVGGSGNTDGPAVARMFAVVRYQDDGAVDPTFGQGGIAMVGSPHGYAAPGWGGIAVLSDGRVMLAGTDMEYPGNSVSDFAIARFLSDGNPDPTFGTNGVVTTDIAGVDYGNAIAVQRDGRAIVAGMAGANSATSAFALVRYLP